MKRDTLLDSYLKRLRMPTVAREYSKVAAEAAKENKPYEAFLLALLEAEVATRESNAVKKRIASAGFPRSKEIAEYDFTQIPGLKKTKNPATDPMRLHPTAGKYRLPPSDHRRVGICPSDPGRGATPFWDSGSASKSCFTL